MANSRTNYRKSGRSSYSGSRARSYRYGYQYGSEAPAVYPEESRGRRSEQEQRRVAQARNRSRQHASAMNAAVIAFLLGVVALMCAALFSYIALQSEVTQSVKEIASYESTLSSLKEANDETYNEIVASVDLAEIKERAMSELGMTYAEENQIISYQGDTTDYVHQVQEVGR